MDLEQHGDMGVVRPNVANGNNVTWFNAVVLQAQFLPSRFQLNLHSVQLALVRDIPTKLPRHPATTSRRLPNDRAWLTIHAQSSGRLARLFSRQAKIGQVHNSFSKNCPVRDSVHPMDS